MKKKKKSKRKLKYAKATADMETLRVSDEIITIGEEEELDHNKKEKEIEHVS